MNAQIPYDCWCTYATNVQNEPWPKVETERIATHKHCKLHGEFAEACKRYNGEAPDVP